MINDVQFMHEIIQIRNKSCDLPEIHSSVANDKLIECSLICFIMSNYVKYLLYRNG